MSTSFFNWRVFRMTPYLLRSSREVDVTSVYRLAVHRLLPTRNGHEHTDRFIKITVRLCHIYMYIFNKVSWQIAHKLTTAHISIFISWLYFLKEIIIDGSIKVCQLHWLQKFMSASTTDCRNPVMSNWTNWKAEGSRVNWNRSSVDSGSTALQGIFSLYFPLKKFIFFLFERQF